MQVGDLVQWRYTHGRHRTTRHPSETNTVVGFGIITKRSSPYRFYVEWTYGKQGWFHVDSLEVVCK